MQSESIKCPAVSTALFYYSCRQFLFGIRASYCEHISYVSVPDHSAATLASCSPNTFCRLFETSWPVETSGDAPVPAPPGRARAGRRAAGARDHAVERGRAADRRGGGARGVDRAERPRGRRHRRRPPGRPRRRAPGVLTFDMGGTSCDVALVRGRRARRGRRTTVIAGHPLHLPMLDVHDGLGRRRQHRLGRLRRRAAGGAALGRRPPGSRGLRRSAATEPTVTDANVVLGRLPLDAPLGGRDPARPRPRRSGRGAGWPGELGLTPERLRRGHPDRRRAGDGAGPAAGQRRARRGPARGQR